MLSKLCSIFCPSDQKPAGVQAVGQSKQQQLTTAKSTEILPSISQSSSEAGNPFTDLVQLLSQKTDADFFISFAQFDSQHDTADDFNNAQLEKLYHLEKMVSRRILVERVCEISNRDITAWIRSEPRIRYM